MKELPISIGIISFVAGLVLLIAAIFGQKIEIAAVKMPELVDPKRRTLAAIFGIVLIMFGTLENRPVVSATQPVTQPAPAAGVSATNTASARTAASPQAAGCIAAAPSDDVQIIPVERDLRTDRKFSSTQPRDGLVSLQFTKSGVTLGVVTYRTMQSGLGFRVESVSDGACVPVTSYTNFSNPGAPNGVIANYETMEYHFPGATVRMDIAYCEGRDCLSLRAQLIAP